MTTDTCDPISELRLRRWARENYVPAEQRGSNWNATVLDEMARRDTELQDILALPRPEPAVLLRPAA